MINTGFKLSAKEIKQLDEFKRSAAYSSYIKAIVGSPIYMAMIKEYIENVELTSDIEKLKKEGLIDRNIDVDVLTVIFKHTFARMIANVVADTIILKELEDISVEDVIKKVKEDINILYLTGMADDKYYIEAKKLLENGKLKRDDIAYRGLMVWMKKNENVPQLSLQVSEEQEQIQKPRVIKNEINIDSLNIDVGE